MIITIPDWILFAVLMLVGWRIARRIWRLAEWLYAERHWRKDRIDYYNMTRHRVRFEEATSGSTGPSRADAGTEALR